MENPNKLSEYTGFEQGPIRPPSEAFSLLIRITRNCPWNKCAFCPVYKDTHFSVRPVEHVLKDIDQIIRSISLIEFRFGGDLLSIANYPIHSILADVGIESLAFQCAVQWYAVGMHSVFLQDANSLVLPTDKLLVILNKLKSSFHTIQRITSYARSQTIYKKSVEELKQLRSAGLNRLHIGLESGSNQVLQRMKKGVTKEQHIEAGKKVIEANIELSEYYMPGLGGRELWEEHAIESADALNQINPTFIRLRTLAIPTNTPLYQEWMKGNFSKCSEDEIIQELLCFIEHLEGITSYVKSDHILNLLPELEGKLPNDKPKMINIIKTYLSLPDREKLLYIVGRRTGLIHQLSDLDDPGKCSTVEQMINEYRITHSNVHEFIHKVTQMML